MSHSSRSWLCSVGDSHLEFSCGCSNTVAGIWVIPISNQDDLYCTQVWNINIALCGHEGSLKFLLDGSEPQKIGNQASSLFKGLFTWNRSSIMFIVLNWSEQSQASPDSNWSKKNSTYWWKVSWTMTRWPRNTPVPRQIIFVLLPCRFPFHT